MTSTPEQVIANIREAVYASKDMPLNSADRLRVAVDDPSLFSDYISEDAEWAIESLEALLSALEAAEAERDALRKALEPFCRYKTADGLPGGMLRIPDGHPVLFNGIGDDCKIVVTVGDFRRARTLLAGDNHE